MKRSPLKRKKPLVRKGWMTPSLRVTKFTRYRKRPRDRAYMQWIRLQPCAARVFSHLSHCAGPIEADHAGRRGMRQKAADRTCIPMCRQHHRERHDFAGAFRDVGQAAMRYWLDFQITWHQAEYDLQHERVTMADQPLQDAVWRPYEPCRENEQLAAFVRLFIEGSLRPWLPILFFWGGCTGAR